MSKIELKRYRRTEVTDEYPGMVADILGTWVKASDATAAIEKLERSMRESWDSEKRLAASLTTANERIARAEHLISTALDYMPGELIGQYEAFLADAGEVKGAT